MVGQAGGKAIDIVGSTVVWKCHDRFDGLYTLDTVIQTDPFLDFHRALDHVAWSPQKALMPIANIVQIYDSRQSFPSRLLDI
jgi:hypothetical protein